MPLYYGGARIAKLYRGSAPIARAYRGAAILFDAAPAAGGPAFSLIHAGGHTSGTAAITIAGLDFGAAHAARRIVVALGFQHPSGAARTLDSVVANGVGLTMRQQAVGGSTQMDAAIYDGIVPDGTAGLSVALNWSGTEMGAIVGIYRTVAHSYQAGGTEAANVANVNSGSFAVADGGFVVAVNNRRASTDGAVWNAGVDEDAKAEAIQSNLSGMLGSRFYEIGGSIAASTSGGSAGAQRRLAAASYQPD